MDNCLKPLEDNNNLQPGTIIRRISASKDQQGSFLKFDKDYNIILVNIIDMITGYLLANEGVLKKQKDDKLYYYPSTFRDSPSYAKAMKIITSWPLYINNPVLQDKIVKFISISYAPEQIVEMERNDSLNLLFVPVQQKFRIGRFTERRSPERVCNDTFLQRLQVLHQGNHITYLALVLHQKHYIPRFYSAGTRPHDETTTLLKDEEFNFHPSHGGHMRVEGTRDGKKHFLVDAGSNVYGRGVKTPLHVSEQVVEGLKKAFPEFEYTPMAGRGAFGTEQSY